MKTTKKIKKVNNSRLTAKQQVAWTLGGCGVLGSIAGSLIGGIIGWAVIGATIGLTFGCVTGIISIFLIWAKEKFEEAEDQEILLPSITLSAVRKSAEVKKSVQIVHESVQNQTKDMQTLSTQLTKTERDLKQVNADIKPLTELLTTRTNADNNLIKKVDSLAEHAAHAAGKKKLLQKLDLSLDTQIDSLTKANTQQEALGNQLNDRINDFSNSFIQLEKDKTALKKQQKEQEKNKDNMREKISALETKHHALQQTKEDSKQKLEEEKKKNEQLLTRINTLQQDCLALKEKSNNPTNNQETLDTLLNQYKRLEKQRATLKQEHKDQIQHMTTLTTLVNYMNNQGKQLQTQIETWKKNCTELEKTNEDLKVQVIELEAKSLIQEQQYELLNIQFIERGILISEQDKNLKQLNLTIQEQDELITDLMNDLDIKKNEIENLKPQLVTLTNQLRFFQQTPSSKDDEHSPNPSRTMGRK